MKDRIRDTINSAGLTQAAFAKRIGVQQSAVSMWLSGVREPTEAAKALICREFGVSRHWLETGEGEMIDPQTVTDIEQLTRAMEGQSEAKKAILRAVALMPDDLLELVYRYLQDALK